jgi:nucleoside-diphosphate-sugar epimerase
MNMMLTLSVYASICKELGEKFVFPGSETQWNGLTDLTDADLLAEQMVWAATDDNAHNAAFNIANGDVFRWRWLWPQVADHFGLEWEGFEGEPRTLEVAMAGTEDTWRRLAERQGLAETQLDRVASWWHSDADLGREMEVVTDMNKSRAAGFSATRDTRAAFFDYAQRYREARIIP